MYVSAPPSSAHGCANVQAMPNGSDPVWMETVCVEIARERFFLHGQQHQDGIQDPSLTSMDAHSDFSITVWDRSVQEQQQHQVPCGC